MSTKKPDFFEVFLICSLYLLFSLESFHMLVLIFFFSRRRDAVMRLILSHMRRCVEDYAMIQSGDRIAVGVSGG